MSYRGTKRYLAELGDAMAGEGDSLGETSEDEPRGHSSGRSEFFRRTLPRESVEALVEHFVKGRVPASRGLNFAAWGGAYDRVRPDATAFVRRNELVLLQQAVEIDPEAPSAEKQAAQRWLERSWGLVRRWGTGSVYQTFPDPDLADSARACYGSNLGRLVGVNRKYSPEKVLRFQQSIPGRVPEAARRREHRRSRTRHAAWPASWALGAPAGEQRARPITWRMDKAKYKTMPGSREGSARGGRCSGCGAMARL